MNNPFLTLFLLMWFFFTVNLALVFLALWTLRKMGAKWPWED